MSDDVAQMDVGAEAVKGMAGKAVQAVFGFAGTIIFARILGPTSFGGFYFLMSITFIIDRPLRGLDTALRKRFSESEADRGALFGVYLAVFVLYSTVALGAVFLLRGTLESRTGVSSSFLVFSALFLSATLFSPVQSMLAAKGRVGVQTWNDTLRSVLTMPMQLGLVLYGFGAAGMGYGLAGATLVTAGTGLYIVGVRPSVPEWEHVRSTWEFARYSVPTAFVGKAYDRMDILLLGALLTTASVGYYEVAYKMTVPSTFLVGVVVSGVMPKVSNLNSRGESVDTLVSDAIAYTSLFSIPILFGAMALGETLVVTFYSTEYRAAGIYLVGLALYQMIHSQSRVYSSVISGIDRPDVNLRLRVAGLVVNVVVGVALLLEVGGIGVVVATVLAEAVKYGGSVAFLKAELPSIPVAPRPLVMQFVAAGTMYAALRVLAAQVSFSTFLQVFAVVGIGAGVYFMVLFGISREVRVTAFAIGRDLVSA